MGRKADLQRVIVLGPTRGNPFHDHASDALLGKESRRGEQDVWLCAFRVDVPKVDDVGSAHQLVEAHRCDARVGPQSRARRRSPSKDVARRAVREVLRGALALVVTHRDRERDLAQHTVVEAHRQAVPLCCGRKIAEAAPLRLHCNRRKAIRRGEQ